MTPQAHHALGPSQHPMFAACADYEGIRDDPEDIELEELAAEAGVTDDSAKGRGTACHVALAKVLTRRSDPFAGLSDREVGQVRWVAEKVVDIAAAAGYGPEEIKVEQRVTHLKPDFTVQYFGTLDIEFGPFILDAKFGEERDYFPQLAGYALPVQERDESHRIFAKIVYGRLKRVSSYVIDYTTAESVVHGILARRADPNRQPTLNQYCGWCAKRLTCPAINGTVGLLVDRREDWPVKLPTFHVSQSNDPVVLGALRYLWKAYIEPWGKGVEFTTSQLAANGITPLGFRIQSERGRAGYTSNVGVANAMLAAGVSAEQLAEVASFSLAGLVQAYQAQFGGTETSASESVERILTKAGVMARGAKSIKLIREKNALRQISAALNRPKVLHA